MGFNEKMGAWLSEQMEFIAKDKNIQENLFDIPDYMENDIMGEEQVALCKEICKKFLKLSFIINAHQKEMDKLVEYLE